MLTLKTQYIMSWSDCIDMNFFSCLHELLFHVKKKSDHVFQITMYTWWVIMSIKVIFFWCYSTTRSRGWEHTPLQLHQDCQSERGGLVVDRRYRVPLLTVGLTSPAEMGSGHGILATISTASMPNISLSPLSRFSKRCVDNTDRTYLPFCKGGDPSDTTHIV